MRQRVEPSASEASPPPATAPEVSPQAGRPPGRPGAAIALKVGSTLVFTLMLVLVKLASERLPPGEIVFARSAFAVLPIVLMLLWQRELSTALVTRNFPGHLGRALIGVVSMTLWFAALGLLPLAEALAISYASPLILVVFAALLLKETVRVYRWTAVAIGLAGILVILWPRLALARSGAVSSAKVLGAALALASAVSMALAAVTVRRLVLTESTGSIVLYFSLIASACALLSAPFGWLVPTPFEAMLLVGAGLLGGVGQIMITTAYRHGDASVIAPFEYASLVWALAFEFLIFGGVPAPTVILGGLIVVGAGLIIIYRERRLGIERRRQRSASPPPG